MSLIATARRWRLAALLAAVAFTAATLSPALTPPAHAHTGTSGTLCGSTNLITAEYAGQYNESTQDAHYHRWDPYGPEGIFDYHCGYGAGSG